jgi:hypothetical protein
MSGRLDVAAVTRFLAGHEVDGHPVSEAELFAVSGGVGAGYLLREFPRAGEPALELGFRNRPGDPQGWVRSTLDRLGLEHKTTTGGKRGAAKRLTAELAAGNPALVLPGEHFAVAYAEVDGEVRLDDTETPLLVERAAFDAARDRVDSPRNLLVTIVPGEIADLPAAVRAGLADCVRRHAGWSLWAQQLTDRGSKGWPAVFAGRRGLVGALMTVWEAAGTGHLRDLFADSLDAASELLDIEELAEQADEWWEIAGQWEQLAETAVSKDIPEFGWLRQLTVAVAAGSGDAEELQQLRAHYDAEAPFTEDQVNDLFADLGEQVNEIQAAEKAALEDLASSLAN